MKKKLLTLVMAAVLIFSACACGTDEVTEESRGTYDGKMYSDYLLELKAANKTLTLLDKYGSVSSEMEVQAEDGTVISRYETQYLRTEDGRLLFSDVTRDEKGLVVMEINGYSEEGMAGAMYLTSGDFKVVTLHPGTEYEAAVANDSALDWSQYGYTEIASDTKEENGALAVSSVFANNETAEKSEVTYYADKESLELIERKMVNYDAEGAFVNQTVTRYTYGDAAEKDYQAAKTILNGEESCRLTVTIAPETEEMEVQELTVAGDAMVTFQTSRKYKMYSDETLKKKISSIDVTGPEAKVFVVFED